MKLQELTMTFRCSAMILKLLLLI